MSTDWYRRPQVIIGAAVAVIAIIVLAVVIPGCGSDDGANQSASQGSLNVSRPDVLITVAGTDGEGTVIKKAVGNGVTVVIHRAKDGNPRLPGEKVVAGTTNAKGQIQLYAFQPGQYVLVGPHGEKKPVAITKTQSERPISFAVCTSGCK